MKNLDLNSLGVQEMNTLEMQETEGGVIWFVVIAAAVFLTSCVNGPVTIQIGGSNNSSDPSGGGTIRADSSLNGNTFDVPIGY